MTVTRQDVVDFIYKEAKLLDEWKLLEWAELFKGTNLIRTLTVVGVHCFSQAVGETFQFVLISGLGFFANYGALFLSNAGISNIFLIFVLREFSS